MCTQSGVKRGQKVSDPRGFWTVMTRLIFWGVKLRINGFWLYGVEPKVTFVARGFLAHKGLRCLRHLRIQRMLLFFDFGVKNQQHCQGFLFFTDESHVLCQKPRFFGKMQLFGYVSGVNDSVWVFRLLVDFQSLTKRLVVDPRLPRTFWQSPFGLGQKVRGSLGSRPAWGPSDPRDLCQFWHLLGLRPKSGVSLWVLTLPAAHRGRGGCRGRSRPSAEMSFCDKMSQAKAFRPLLWKRGLRPLFVFYDFLSHFWPFGCLFGHQKCPLDTFGQKGTPKRPF